MASRFSRPSCSSSLDLVGEALLAVGDAVRERRLHEAAVAAARRRADLGRFDQHDVAGRVALLGDDRRPQPGVAAADDAEVARLGANEGRVRVRLVDVVVPIGKQVGVGDGVEMRSDVAVVPAHVSLTGLVPRQCMRHRGCERVSASERAARTACVAGNAMGGMTMDLGITGKRAAVAAASSGLGLASAKALAAEGVRVAICGRDKARLDVAAAEIGRDCVALVADVSDAAGGASFVAAAGEALGGVDILVTNAGGPPAGTSPPLRSMPIRTPSHSTCYRSSGCARRRRRRCQERGWVVSWRSRRSPCVSRSPT